MAATQRLCVWGCCGMAAWDAVPPTPSIARSVCLIEKRNGEVLVVPFLSLLGYSSDACDFLSLSINRVFVRRLSRNPLV